MLLYRDLDWERRVEGVYTEIAFVARYGNQDIEKVERWPKAKRRRICAALTKLIKAEYKD